jgi:5-methylcytosine-specific restriction endonuclease McrA
VATSLAAKKERERAWVRQRGCCYYCGRHVPKERATFDHCVPRCRGGAVKNNGVMACEPCNGRKGDMPAEEFLALRYDPKEDVDRRPRLSEARLEMWKRADALSASA